jgi:hypothetical protein
MLESVILLILANQLRDIYNQVASTIIEAKSNRPTWKITTLRISDKDPISGMTIEKEEKIVEKLTPLIAMAKTLEEAAYLNKPLDFNSKTG